ncbi:hypothetical protein ACFL13_02190 [Patescibacteria group bacterium]
MKLLSSIVKGCLVALLIAILVIIISIFVKSTKEPVEIFGVYRINNFEITRLQVM